MTIAAVARPPMDIVAYPGRRFVAVASIARPSMEAVGAASVRALRALLPPELGALGAALPQFFVDHLTAPVDGGFLCQFDFRVVETAAATVEVCPGEGGW